VIFRLKIISAPVLQQRFSQRCLRLRREQGLCILLSVMPQETVGLSQRMYSHLLSWFYNPYLQWKALMRIIYMRQ